jgi:hypothetical protein
MVVRVLQVEHQEQAAQPTVVQVQLVQAAVTYLLEPVVMVLIQLADLEETVAMRYSAAAVVHRVLTASRLEDSPDEGTAE